MDNWIECETCGGSGELFDDPRGPSGNTRTCNDCDGEGGWLADEEPVEPKLSPENSSWLRGHWPGRWA